METLENNCSTMSDPDPNSEEHERGFDDLMEKMENVVLKSEENHGSVANASDDHKDSGGVLPLRPYAGDCPHYVRTGTCKFGLSCRYNHPAKKAQQFVKGKDLDSENSGTILCKYFATAGGCKYGKSCRYSHPGEEPESAVPALNFLGLPLRWGEKECQFYMRNGSCGYGSSCVYHHPERSSLPGNGPVNSNDNFERRAVLSENRNHESLHRQEASQSYEAHWSLHKLSNNVGPHSENHSSAQEMHKQSEWNAYQASRYSHESRNSHSTNGSVRKTDAPLQVDEFPERPGQPECDYFMKTGNCKFKSTCRFHHPKDRTSRPTECVLSENGLPLRPGKSICRHFERLGLCKFGPACLFDHPVAHGLSTYPNYPNWSASRTSVISNGGGWDD